MDTVISDQPKLSDKQAVSAITKKAIEDHGLSLARFGKDLKTDRQRVFQWVNGSTIPNTKIIARALAVGTNPGKEHVLEWAREILSTLGES